MVNRLSEEVKLTLSDFEINPEVAHLIPYDIAKLFTTIPVLRLNSKLLLAMQNPNNPKAITIIKNKTKMELQCIQADPDEILKQINKHFLLDREPT